MLTRLYSIVNGCVRLRISLTLMATGRVTRAALVGPSKTTAATVRGKPSEIVASPSSRTKFSETAIASTSTTNAAFS